MHKLKEDGAHRPLFAVRRYEKMAAALAKNLFIATAISKFTNIRLKTYLLL